LDKGEGSYGNSNKIILMVMYCMTVKVMG
jgi:hypothetical protein